MSRLLWTLTILGALGGGGILLITLGVGAAYALALAVILVGVLIAAMFIYLRILGG